MLPEPGKVFEPLSVDPLGARDERNEAIDADVAARQRDADALAGEPVSYTHLTLPTNREV